MPEPFISKFARELAKAIEDGEKIGINKTELARQIGISSQVFTNAFNKMRAFGPSTAYRITEILKFTPERTIAFLRSYVLDDKLDGHQLRGFVEELFNGIEQLPKEAAKQAFLRACRRLAQVADRAPSAHKK